MKAVVRKLKLIPSCLTYAITLFVKLNSTNNTFTCSTKVTPKLLGVLNSPNVTREPNYG
jgi:hypothetical protein